MDANPEADSFRLTLADGTPALIRPWGPNDAEKLKHGFQRLSEESRILRFLCQKGSFTPQEFQILAHPDGISQIAYLAAILDENGTEVDKVAVARCFRKQNDPGTGEIAAATIDECQGLGIGTALIEALATNCKRQGIRYWVAHLFADNNAMRKLLRRVGRRISREAIDSAVVEEVYELHF